MSILRDHGRIAPSDPANRAHHQLELTLRRDIARTTHFTAKWAAVASLFLGMTALGAVPATAQDPAPNGSNPVVFLGDSVTAGYGYLGAKEDPAVAVGTVNEPFANNWLTGPTSLSYCTPVSDGVLDDRCSNNNVLGAPWDAGSWKQGVAAPNVAYSYQIAARQNANSAVPVQNWAITGSTPQMWDVGGDFSSQLQKVKNTTVVMTLGANPILASLMEIDVIGFPKVSGDCVDSTLGFDRGSGWFGYPAQKVVDCVNEQWASNNQTAHLENVYKTLLQNNNKVLALGYYRMCPWSFGEWQPEANLFSGPATGYSCRQMIYQKRACPKCDRQGTISQWTQAVAAQNEINQKIQSAVADVQQWAKGRGLNPHDLQYTIPDADVWTQHQAWSDDSWIFKNDTWIHPSKAGHAQLANTVTAQTCASWGQWCGSKPTWNARPVVPAALVAQSLQGSPPRRMDNKAVKDLPTLTKQGNPVRWASKTRGICRVISGDLYSRAKDGPCSLRATAFRSGSEKGFTSRHTVLVK